MMKKVVVIGGGTGTFAVLSGLKQYDVELSAVITMMDSGGSTGRLRDQYGVLPPGDIRQALVALSQSDQVWRQLFLYRFDSGDLAGHNFGNIFLTALEKITGNYEQSLELAQQILGVKGAVIPITLEKTHLTATLTDGTVIKTEALIDQKIKRAPIEKLILEDHIPVNPKALEAISAADVIVIGPGDVFTSVLPNFVFSDFVQKYSLSKAKKVFILNLMNKVGQTDNFKATEHLKTYEKYIGIHPFEYVLVNTAAIPPSVREHYAKYGEDEIVNDLPTQEYYKVCTGDFLSDIPVEEQQGDKLSRSLIRHSPEKLASYIWNEIINK